MTTDKKLIDLLEAAKESVTPDKNRFFSLLRSASSSSEHTDILSPWQAITSPVAQFGQGFSFLVEEVLWVPERIVKTAPRIIGRVYRRVKEEIF